MDWREQLRRNERRTYFVLTLFIAIYLAVGLLVDIWIVDSSIPPQYRPVDLSKILLALVTFKVIPVATLIMGGIAILSLWIAYAFYNRLMLLGTEYHEVTSNSKSLEEKQLYHVVEELTIAAGLRYVPKVYIIEADYMNAFASGYSEKSAMVAITQGLMSKLNRAELQAVMAHELSHIRHHDIKLTLTVSILSNLMLMALDGLFYAALFGRNGNNKSDNRLLLIVMLLRYILPLVNILLMLYLSRTREYMADAGCVELMRDNTPMANALRKIDADYKANSEAYQAQYDHTAHEGVRRASYLYDPLQAGIRSDNSSLSSLFSTHPTIADRLAALGFKK